MTGFHIDNKPFSSSTVEPGLYIVSTPIGNLKDITIRALETLSGVDMIACEDTRVTGKLLSRYRINVPMIAYHEHNAEQSGRKIRAMLEEGKSVALVSDAGTPVISDPGFLLISQIRDAGHTIVPVPGPSAPITALVGSGISAELWSFVGFLPNKQSARQKRLEELKSHAGTLIFFESPNRLAASLRDLSDILGGTRSGAVCRELTKMHEEFVCESLAGLVEKFEDHPVKGEIVIVVGPAMEEPTQDIDLILTELVARMSVSRAAAEAAALTGLSKRTLYQRALAMAKDPQ